LDAQGTPGFTGHRLMTYNTTAHLVLTLKTAGVIYEVRTDVTLKAEQGFSTLNTVTTKL